MDSDKVRGDIQHPFQQETETTDRIDPEKFKKVMKIEDTDEAQKRNKRNLKREEEEGEDEDVEENIAPPSASTSFSEFMSDKDQLSNVLDSESEGVRYQTAAEVDDTFIPPEAGVINTEGVDSDESEALLSPQYQEPKQKQQTPPPSEQSHLSPKYATNIEPQSQDAQSKDADAQNADQQSQPQEKKTKDQPSSKKKSEKDASLLASQPKMSDLTTKKKHKKPAAKVKTRPENVDTSPIERTSAERKKTTKKDKTSVSKPQEAKDPAAPLDLETNKEKVQKQSEDLTPHAHPQGHSAPTSETSPFFAPPAKGKESDENLLIPLEKEKTEGSINAKPLSSSQRLEKVQKNDKKTPTPLEKPDPNAPSISKTSAEPPLLFQRSTPQEIRNQRLEKESKAMITASKKSIATSSEGKQIAEAGKKNVKDDPSFIETSSQNASIPLPTFEPPVTPVAATQSAPSYARLPPEVHELFEKMGGIMIVQLDKGMTTTTVNITMPNSVFNGAQVILNQYSSAPHSYNIQLVGSPEAVELFTDHMTQLENSFREANFDFEVRILNPSINQTKKSPHLIRRKNSAGDKGGGDKGNDSNAH